MVRKIKETTEFLIKEGFIGATTGVVLGTGLGEFINEMKIEKQIA